MRLPVKRINYSDPDTFLCLRLGMLGFSTRLIQKKTSLTPPRQRYRLTRAGIHLKDYRDGESDVAEFVIERTKESITRDLERVVKMLTNGRQSKVKSNRLNSTQEE